MKKIITIYCVLLLWINMQGKVVISQIMYDSPLNERIDKPPYSNGEFVEIYNTGTKDEILSNWKLVGGGVTETFLFPDNILLPSGNSLIIAYRHSATDNFNFEELFPSDSEGVPYNVIYQRKIILSNKGESLKLVNSSGIVVDSIFYTNIASNVDTILYSRCNSLHRIRISLGLDGNVLSNIDDWNKDTVSRGRDTPLEDFAYSSQSPEFDTLPSKRNYRLTATPLDKIRYLTLKNGHIEPNDSSRIQITCDVYDGLGRPQQTIFRRHSAELYNISSLMEHNALNNKTKIWLPISYIRDSIFSTYQLKTFAQLNYDDNFPYSSTIYESSPLEKPRAFVQEGSIYQPHPTTMKYETNIENDVISWRTASNGVVRCGYYPKGTLFMTTTIDDGKKKVEYKDFQGRLILQKQGNDTLWASTYYVYDDYSRLSYVLPPNTLQLLTNNMLYTEDNPAISQFAYIYHYNSHDLPVSKKLPGCAPVLMIYDKSDKMILSQDGNQRARGNYWTYNAYDNSCRLLYLAEVQIANVSFSELSHIYRDRYCTEEISSGMENYSLGYTTSAISYSSLKPLYAYYYDDYSYIDNLSQAIRDSLEFRTNHASSERYSNSVRLMTGARIYNVNNNQSKVISYYYDAHKNIVQSNSVEDDGKHYSFFAKYNHDGTLSYSEVINNSHIETSDYIYDHAGRLRKHFYRLDNNPQIVLTHNFFDERDNLAQKLLHNGQVKNRFTFDMRNHVSALQSGPYGEFVYRADNLPANTNALYDGRVSAIAETYPNIDFTYRFDYDALSRLSQSSIEIENQVTPSEEFIYDLHGNILSLRRYNEGDLIDDLSFSYKGNQVCAIEESVETLSDLSRYGYTDRSHLDTTIRYDANGNMSMDLDRNILMIKYNILNLPDTIVFATGDSIINEYNALGEKISRSFCFNDHSRHIIQYNKNIETTYSQSANSSELTKEKDIIYNNEGYCQYVYGTTEPQFSQYYYCRDHLGNNVAVWNADTKQIEQQTLYYATGLPMNNSTNDDLQPYKYNNKELVSQFSLNEYDSEARMYYAPIMRATTIDPQAESYYHISPYAWCGNNPINVIDPNGCNPVYDTLGNFLGINEFGLQGEALIINADKFENGISIEESIQLNHGVDYLSPEALKKYQSHYNSLPSRPDWDGVVTPSEGISWAKSHPSALSSPAPDNMLYINSALLDFGNISISDCKNGIGKVSNINLFNDENIKNSFLNPSLRNTVYALGLVNIILMDKFGIVQIVNDEATDYDWNAGGSIKRDLLIHLEWLRTGLSDRHGFKTFYYGYGNIKIK